MFQINVLELIQRITTLHKPEPKTEQKTEPKIESTPKPKLNVPAQYYQSCCDLLSVVVKQMKLIIQQINADTDGCSSDLHERLTNNYTSMCNSYNELNSSIPKGIMKFYNNKPKCPQYDNPIIFIKKLIDEYSQKNDLEKIITCLDIALTLVEAGLDTITVYNIKSNDIQHCGYAMSVIILFMLDVTENVHYSRNTKYGNYGSIKLFYDDYNRLLNINGVIEHLSVIYYKSKAISQSHSHTLRLMSKWTKIYESNMLPEKESEYNNELTDSQTKFTNKVKLIRYTDTLKDMIKLIEFMLDFMDE